MKFSERVDARIELLFACFCASNPGVVQGAQPPAQMRRDAWMEVVGEVLDELLAQSIREERVIGAAFNFPTEQEQQRAAEYLASIGRQAPTREDLIAGAAFNLTKPAVKP